MSCETCNLCFTTELSLGWHRQLFHPTASSLPKVLREKQLQNVPSKILNENQTIQQPQTECKDCNGNANVANRSLIENNDLSKEKDEVQEVRLTEIILYINILLLNRSILTA